MDFLYEIFMNFTVGIFITSNIHHLTAFIYRCDCSISVKLPSWRPRKYPSLWVLEGTEVRLQELPLLNLDLICIKKNYTETDPFTFLFL